MAPRASNRDAARAEYDAIMKDPKSAYWDRRDPKAHRQAVLAVEHLAGIIYGRSPAPLNTGVDPTVPARSYSPGESATLARDVEYATAMTQAMLQDHDHPLNRRNHPGHAEAVEVYNKLVSVIRRVPGRTYADGLFANAVKSRRP